MLNWFDLDLHELVKEFLFTARHPSDEERQFEEHIRRIEAPVIFLIMVVTAALILVIWPTDWLIFGGRILDAFFRWRLAVLMILSGSLLGMITSGFLRRHAGFLLVSVMGLSAFVVCYIFGNTFEEGFRNPFFYWTYVLPFGGCFILSFRLVPRILATLIMVIPSFFGFLLADPTHLQYRYAASPFLVQLALIPLSIFTGHIVHNLYRRYYFLNRELENSIDEKKFLFQELNHRVKNNMQVIMSLIKMRSNEIDHETTREKFLSLRRRIRAMATVHEKLYQTEGYSKIDLKEYLEDLLEGLIQSQGELAEDISLNLKFDDNHLISLRQTVPMGLIVNELVSNALTHAFDDQDNPVIKIHYTGRDDWRALEIADNGRGFPEEEPDFEQYFGLNIVRTLVENQLDGTIDFEQNGWTRFRIQYIPEEGIE